MTERTNLKRVERFSFSERLVHWLAALSFLYAALSGLALWSPHLYWMAAVLGGGSTTAWLHPWGGTVFTAVVGAMFMNWARQMRLDADDKRWLRNIRRYAIHDTEGLPEPGRFNAGQKMLFWTQLVCALLLFASGFVLWWVEEMPRGLLLAAILLHPAAAVVAISGIIVHIYMGTAATPGSFRAMARGWVPRGWAAAHHPKWLREISKN